MVRGEIARNTAGKNGGGVVIYSNQNLCSFNEVTMTGNSASGGEGGAILITTGKYCSLYDCPINGNTASTYGQDISTKGTLYLYGSTSVNDCYVMTASSNPAAVKVDSSITGSTSFSLDSYTTGKAAPLRVGFFAVNTLLVLHRIRLRFLNNLQTIIGLLVLDAKS